MNGLATRKHLRAAAHPDAYGDIPSFLPNAHGLGTPMKAERLRKERMERRVRFVCKPIIWALILAGAFVSGLNVRQREPMTSGIEYRAKAERLAVNSHRHELDLHEACMVFMHKDATGQPSVSWHC